MKRLTSYVCAAAMAASTAGFGMTGASAQPMPAPTTVQSQTFDTNVIQVRSHNRSERRNWRDRDRFERRGNRAYFRGYRGQREPRRGWRQHQGWWFPPAAFAMGAIIGGALAQQAPAPRRGLSHAHIQWCYDRYVSYRSYDNTFQPYQGPRRECRSPYG